MYIGIHLLPQHQNYQFGRVKKKDEKIILYKEQAEPNGVEGYFRLTFYDVSKSGYKWIGEWVDKAEKIVYPTWKINCIREE